MKTTTLKCYSLGYAEARTWLITALFVAGNILLPQLAHLLPAGGATWLPIYLFTLVAAYKYGWRAGLLTALLSPVANNLLFGMPAAEVLPAILVKSALLAFAAAYAAHRWQRASLLLLAAVVASYQLLGSLFEWAWTGSLVVALQDLRLGIPGMLLQIFGGWWLLNRLLRSL